MQRVDRDHRELQRRRRDHQRVEDLVVAEDLGARVGPAGRVDHRADRVERAAEGEQPDAERADPVPELRHRRDRDPAGRDVDDRGEPLRRVPPGEVQDRPAGRAGPDGDQDHVGERALHHQQRERRVGAGDQHEDHRVVEAAHPAARAVALPVDPVVDGARAEQRRQGEGVYGGCDDLARPAGHHDQGDAERHRDDRRPLVRDPAHARLRDLLDDLDGGVGRRVARGADALGGRVARGRGALARGSRRRSEAASCAAPSGSGPRASSPAVMGPP